MGVLGVADIVFAVVVLVAVVSTDAAEGEFGGGEFVDPSGVDGGKEGSAIPVPAERAGVGDIAGARKSVTLPPGP
jgi:hypothetical protein